MKGRAGFVRICVIGAALSIMGSMPGNAWAQSAAADQSTMTPAAPIPYWWFTGTIEVGGRFFLNNPQRDGANYKDQNSLAKYYEYSDIAPGAFSNVALSTGSKDGLYQVDLGGSNIGYDDQGYYLDFSQIGKQYFSASWDQSPHLYSTSAQTPYLGVGTNALTLPAGALGKTPQTIVPFDHQTDLGIDRNTASIQYRWTPTDAWDIHADYSNMHRSGTQADGITGINGSAYSHPIQVPKPVSDTTQNYDLNGEYVGTSPWGQRITFKMGYNGSQYDDDFAAYTVQSPSGEIGQMSLPPSNRADAVSGLMSAELPGNSRYVGQLSYTMMRQNQSFIPMSYNAAYTLPQSSLDGEIDTLSINNMLNTQITPDLTSKLTYRYYDFDNNTPEIYFPDWICYDSSAACSGHYVDSLSMGYIKQNIGEQFNWRPSREWNFGVIYGFERYDWTRADANATNENSGKLFADWKPAVWLGVRTSAYYANRQTENYDYLDNVGNFQFPQPLANASYQYQSSYRQLMLDDRQTWKANVSVDLVAIHGLTLTPNFQYQDQSYGIDPTNQQGLQDSRSWSAGIDATYLVNPRTSIMFGYTHEHYRQLLYACNTDDTTHTVYCPPDANPTTGAFDGETQTDDKTNVDSFTAAFRYIAIPDKLKTELRYTLSNGVDSLRVTPVPASGQFTDYTTWFQRLDATAVYTFDKETVAKLGWKGTVKAKLHYAWERNSVSDWANDSVAPYNSWASGAIFMAYDNPNYSVHIVMASLAFAW